MRILLSTMPFHKPSIPSIGLTQIKERLSEMFVDELEVDLLYLNHDFYRYFGKEMYLTAADSATYNGVNEWIFRKEAFDGVSDNQEAYFQRFFPAMPDEMKLLLRQKIDGLGGLIDKLIADYEILSYDLVGVNATFSVVPGLALFRHIKSKKSNGVTVMGGSGVRGSMGRALIKYFPHVDFICSGYGLVSFPKMVERLMNGARAFSERFPPQAHHIDGILSKTNVENVKTCAPPLDINHCPPLNYDSFLNSYSKLGVDYAPTLLLETSRGCAWGKCKFCGANEDIKHYETKGPEKAVDEINGAIDRYGLDIEFVDNMMPKRYIKKVLPFIHAPEHLALLYEVRADLKDEDCAALREAKVRIVQPGIESLSTGALKLMNKGINALQAINFLRLCSNYGLLPSWNLIIAIPGMSREMYRELIERMPLLVHLLPPSVLTPVRFDRFSVYFEESEKYGLKLAPFSMYEYIYPYAKTFLSEVAYYFQDDSFSTVPLMMEFHTKLSSLIEEWKNKWSRENVHDFPGLYRVDRNGESIVCDARQETKREYALSSTEKAILDLLKSPMSADHIKRAIPDENKDAFDDAAASLEEKCFILEENGEYVNLVVANDKFEQINYLLSYRRKKKL